MRLVHPPTGPSSRKGRASEHALFVVLLVTLLWRVAYAASIDSAGVGDPNYYDDVARAFARGEGLASRCLWNLSNLPDELPHPACVYWGPGVPLLVGSAYRLFGTDLRVAQGLMIVLALGLALCTARVARLFLDDERHIFAVGLLAAFHLQLCYFSVTIDTPIPFALFANLCLVPLALANEGWTKGFFLALPGALAAQLTRADGVLLSLLVFLFAAIAVRRNTLSPKRFLLLGLLFAIGWAPWLVRNRLAFGKFFPSSLTESIALSSYSDLFKVNTRPNLETYLAQPIAKIFKEKLAASAEGVRTIVASENLVFLAFLPFALPGLLRSRVAAPFLAYFALLFAAMSLVFNFQSQNGSLLHSLPALLPFLMTGSIAGLRTILEVASAGEKGSLTRWLGRTLARPAAGILVVYVAVQSGASLTSPSAHAKAFSEMRALRDALNEWWRTAGGPHVRLMSNDSLDLVGLLGAPVVQEPRDPGEATVFDLARRYRVDYLVAFDHPRYSIRAWDRPLYRRGRESLVRVLERPLECTMLGHKSFGIFRFVRSSDGRGSTTGL